MTDFIAAIMKPKTVWSLSSIVGHSLGGMSILNAAKKEQYKQILPKWYRSGGILKPRY
jgi:hypothetical protein